MAKGTSSSLTGLDHDGENFAPVQLVCIKSSISKAANNPRKPFGISHKFITDLNEISSREFVNEPRAESPEHSPTLQGHDGRHPTPPFPAHLISKRMRAFETASHHDSLEQLNGHLLVIHCCHQFSRLFESTFFHRLDIGEVLENKIMAQPRTSRSDIAAAAISMLSCTNSPKMVLRTPHKITSPYRDGLVEIT
jgi:hypothetical protein